MLDPDYLYGVQLTGGFDIGFHGTLVSLPLNAGPAHAAPPALDIAAGAFFPSRTFVIDDTGVAFLGPDSVYTVAFSDGVMRTIDQGGTDRIVSVGLDPNAVYWLTATDLRRSPR